MSENLINIAIYVTYGLLAIAVLTSIVFPIIHFAKDFSKAKGTLIGLAVLVVVLLVAYVLSTGEPYEGVSAMASRWISAGITSVFILAGLAIVAAVFTEVVKVIR